MYAIMSGKTKMPGSCWGGQHYYKIAIVKLDGARPLDEIKMISDRAIGIESIVWFRDRLFRGKTNRSAFAMAMAEANRELARLECVG